MVYLITIRQVFKVPKDDYYTPSAQQYADGVAEIHKEIIKKFLELSLKSECTQNIIEIA